METQWKKRLRVLWERQEQKLQIQVDRSMFESKGLFQHNIMSQMFS